MASMVGTAAKAGAPPALHFESEEDAKRLVDHAVERMAVAGVAAAGQVAHRISHLARFPVLMVR